SGASQLAVSLPAGTSCIVIDSNSGAVATGALHFTVVPGGRDGAVLGRGARTKTGDTCNESDQTDANDAQCAHPGANDAGFFFTVCPNETLTVDASTCNATTAFDSAIYIRMAGHQDAACDDDPDPACSANADAAALSGVTVDGPGLGWVIVDGFDPNECGP